MSLLYNLFIVGKPYSKTYRPAWKCCQLALYTRPLCTMDVDEILVMRYYYVLLLTRKQRKRAKEIKYWVHPILREKFSLQGAAGGGLSAPTPDKCQQRHSCSWASEIQNIFFPGVGGWQNTWHLLSTQTQNRFWDIYIYIEDSFI